MTRATYLKKLEKNLSSLTESEIKDAISYYSNYFDDANDDAKVINELGSPEELASQIIEKSQKRLIEMNEQSEEKTDQNASDGLYFEFDYKLVKNLNISIGAAEVAVITGKTVSVETRGIAADAINCNLSQNGTLTINNEKRINIDFFKHNRKYRPVPRVLISLPDNLTLDLLKVKIGAGSIVAKEITVSAVKGEFEAGAGNLILNRINVNETKIKCGMGNCNFSGSIGTSAEIDCGMGNLSLNLDGNPADFSYDAKVGLGDFRFNDEKKSGVGQIECSNRKKTHLSVNCGMGNVSIKVGENYGR